MSVRSPSETTTLDSSRRAMRFSMLCAIAAFVAFAPKRSTTVCNRAISFDCTAAFFASRARLPRGHSCTGCRCRDIPRLRPPSPPSVDQMQHPSDRFVEQIKVVTDHEQPAAIIAEKVQQPCLGIDIEVVRRFVQKQCVAAREQDARQLHTTRSPPDNTCSGSDSRSALSPSPAAIARLHFLLRNRPSSQTRPRPC